ncbi:MAG TPA: hypothetical protein VGF80_11970 [Galbitalea sp.]|jgi:hypothetical protein
MTDTGESYQQLDPVGSYGSRPITLVMSLGIVVVAAGATAISWPAVSDPITAYLAILATAVAALGITFWSSPLRAPFRRSGFLVVTIAAAASLVLCSLSTWTAHTDLVNRWAPITVGLILVQLSSYRPARELVTATILGGILAGFLAVIHPAGPGYELPALVRVLDAALPIVALGLGATEYSSVLVRSLGEWFARPGNAERAVSSSMKDRVVRSVHDDRVTILNDSVVPFLTGLLERNDVSADDRETARSIAFTIRSAMVADVNRSWLDSIMDHLAEDRGDPSIPGSEVVQDPHRAAGGMTTEQRIVIRAVILALFDHPGFDSDGFAILITLDNSTAEVTVTAKLDDDGSVARSGLGPYFAVLRIAFRDLHVTFQRPTLTLKFSYEHK